MEIVKKNLLSIICGVVALTAAAALYYPVYGMYEDTQKELDKRKNTFTQNDNLRKSRRSWPAVPDMGGVRVQPLTAFPVQSLYEKGNEIKNQVHAQADAMQTKTTDDNRHSLLVPGVLPKPNHDVDGFTFQTKYVQEVQQTLPMQLSGITSMPPAATAPAAPVPGGVAPARPTPPWMPPTDAEVYAEGDRLWREKFEKTLIPVGGKFVNEPQVQADWQKTCSTLQSELRQSRAQQCKLYLEPQPSGGQDAQVFYLAVNRAMLAKTGQAPEAKQIWYAQMMLWIQQDVVAAINRVTANSKNVMESPIKRIFKLDIPDDVGLYVTSGVTGTAGNANADATSDASSKAYFRSLTGRVCNSSYDVVQFGIVMDVDASKVAFVLAELQRGRLITIQQCDLSSVDAIGLEDDGYIYGNVPVVRLTLRGEELFLRSWTIDLMPTDVKKELGIPLPVPPGQNPQGPGH